MPTYITGFPTLKPSTTKDTPTNTGNDTGTVRTETIKVAIFTKEFQEWGEPGPPPHQLQVQDFGGLSHMLYFGYLGQTFGALSAKRHICHNILCYVEDKEDTVVSQELLQPDYSYPGLPYTFSVPHDLYPYQRCNAVAADHSRRIVLDCEIAENMLRVVPQSLFVPYVGLRSEVGLQSASLLPPIFFFRLDHSVGLPLETAKFTESQNPLLLFDDWCPMEGSKASIKLRIAVRCPLTIQHRHFSHLSPFVAVERL